MDNNEETVTISVKEYKELRDDALWRDCVSNARVDNWDGYEYAMEEYWEAKENQD